MFIREPYTPHKTHSRLSQVYLYEKGESEMKNFLMIKIATFLVMSYVSSNHTHLLEAGETWMSHRKKTQLISQ